MNKKESMNKHNLGMFHLIFPNTKTKSLNRRMRNDVI
jgi:hypothetical protein